jgi:hypothetical protein
MFLPGMVWGWIIAMVFIQCVALSLAELCSSMPTRSELHSQSIVYYILTFLVQWWSLLRVRCSCTHRMGPCCILGDWLVQLDWTSHRRTIGQLFSGGNDSCCSIHNRPKLRTNELGAVPSHHFAHARPKLHQQHADQVDRYVQFFWVQFQHGSSNHCYRSHTCSYYNGT